jgi:hypothetical protein
MPSNSAPQSQTASKQPAATESRTSKEVTAVRVIYFQSRHPRLSSRLTLTDNSEEKAYKKRVENS